MEEIGVIYTYVFHRTKGLHSFCSIFLNVTVFFLWLGNKKHMSFFFCLTFPDVDLLICKHQGPSCCTRKMEESYQFAVKRETLHNIHSYSYELEHLLSGHADAFQGKCGHEGAKLRSDGGWSEPLGGDGWMETSCFFGYCVACVGHYTSRIFYLKTYPALCLPEMNLCLFLSPHSRTKTK